MLVILFNEVGRCGVHFVFRGLEVAPKYWNDTETSWLVLWLPTCLRAKNFRCYLCSPASVRHVLPYFFVPTVRVSVCECVCMRVRACVCTCTLVHVRICFVIMRPHILCTYMVVRV